MFTNSQLFCIAPNWQLHHAGLRQQLPKAVQSWVYETGSLTQRLRRSYGNTVKVTLLRQRWQLALLSEQRPLRLPGHRYALVREVLLSAQGTPLILARTVIPQATIQFAHNNLAHLGTRPLGEVIFAYPGLARRQLEVAKIRPEQWRKPVQTLAAIESPVWGRRTVYALKNQQLLVSEFFLPGCLVL